MKTRIIGLIWVIWVVAASAAADNAPPAGRFLVARLPETADATLSQATFAGHAEVTARAHGCAVTWQATTPGAKRTRGLGMADRDGALAVSLATGGAVNGVAIYRRTEGGHEWRGTWLTSLDGGGAVGEIRFDDAGDGRLVGRHRLECRRPGSGGFEGAVEIAEESGALRLTFEVDRTVLYRGLGVPVDKDRLFVAWSFGSAPALAVLQPQADGLWQERRVTLRGKQTEVTREVWAREGEDAMRLLPAVARTDPAFLRAGADATLEPGSPEIRAWTYEDLQGRYGGPEGWARRWLDEQLSPEERRRLERALKRKKKPAGGTTIGQIIEEERRREGSTEE